jgi:predicted MFS family arabinose efflux permease
MMEMITRSRLAAAWLTMFLVGTELFVFSPLLPLLAADYHISIGVAGLVVTIFSLTYMTCAPLLGHVSDRIGRRRILSCALLVFAAANLLTALVANLPSLLAVRLCAGASAAGISPSIYANLLRRTAAVPGWLWRPPVCWRRWLSVPRRGQSLLHHSAGQQYLSRSPDSAWHSHG